jgi:uncharacterized surface protein with fasciclin (FAS1) repeats
MLMKKSRTALVAALGLAGALTLSATLADARGKSEAGMVTKPGAETITTMVVNNSSFDVLEAAVIRAGLAGVLDGKGQYTVFAPTDAAFESAFDGTSEADLIAAIQSYTDEEAAGLAHILLYHVTEGRRNSTSVLAAPSYQMLNNQSLSREELSEAGIASTDLSASNGVIHVINAVLLP